MPAIRQEFLDAMSVTSGEYDGVATIAANQRFTEDDLNSVNRRVLVDTAFAYLYCWGNRPAEQRNSDYLRDMLNQVNLGNILTNRQLIGVLNWFRGDVIRERNEEERRARAETFSLPQEVTITPPATGVADGVYTVVLSEELGHVTLRLKTATPEKCERYRIPVGSQGVGYLYGPNNESDYIGFGAVNGSRIVKVWRGTDHAPRVAEAVRVLIGSPERAAEFGLAYALRSNRCYVCNRPLTIPASIAGGIGPVCNGRV